MKKLLVRLTIASWIVLLLAAQPVRLVQAAPVQVNGGQSDNFVAGELIVGLEENFPLSGLVLPQGASLEPRSSEMAELGAVLVKVPAGQEQDFREKLLQTAGVLYADFNYLVTAQLIPDDPLFPEQYGPQHVNAPAAWDTTTGSSNVIIAIVDSGVDVKHPEFKGRLVAGYDVINKDTSVVDECGHGTHVAGIAAATGDNGTGIAGIDWQAKIMPVRVLNRSCSGTFADIAQGIVWAVKHGARVINMSFGAFSTNQLLEYATYYAFDHGVAQFAAAGNTDLFGSGVLYPAVYPWVLAVGATDQSDARAGFSRFGPTLDIMAPGVDILSTTPVKGNFYEKGPDTPNQYGLLSGTSMATPHVAGAAALLAGFAQFDSPAKIYQALTDSARDLGAPGRDDQTGFGLLQIDAALVFDPSVVPAPTPRPDLTVEYDSFSSTRCNNVVFDYIGGFEDNPHAAGVFGTHSSRLLDIGFNFDYGGATYNQVTVAADGYLTFGGPGNLFLNFFIPIADPGPPYNKAGQMIAPFWDSLNFSAIDHNGVYYLVDGAAPNRRFTVEWYGMTTQAYFGRNLLSFEATLFEGSNRILFQYLTLSGPQSDGSAATIGVQFNNGTAGTQYAYNQKGALKAGQAILFNPVVAGIERDTQGCVYGDTVGSDNFFDFDPFCLVIPSELVPQDVPTNTTLQATIFRTFPPKPSSFKALGRYADIELNPLPRPLLTPRPMVCYTYTAQDLLKVGGDPKNFFIGMYDTELNLWERLPTTVNAAQHRIFAAVPHFSVFGVFFRSPEVLPVTGAAFELPSRTIWSWVTGMLVLFGLILLVGWRRPRK